MLKDSFLKYLLLERNYSEKTILSYGIESWFCSAFSERK